MVYTLAITNLKGGVAKTTTAVNVGTDLARRGKRVLLIGFDSDMCATQWLGIDSLPNGQRPTRTIYDVLTDPAAGLDGAVATYTGANGMVLSLAGRLDVIPESPRVTAAAADFDASRSRQPVAAFDHVLPWFIGKFCQGYDYVICDPSPSWDRLTDAILYAADGTIAPVSPEYMAVRGVQNYLQRLQENAATRAAHRIPGHTQLLGILISKIIPDQATMAQQFVQALDQNRIPRFQTTVPYTLPTCKAPEEGLPVWAYAPDDTASRCFQAVAAEVEGRIHG